MSHNFFFLLTNYCRVLFLPHKIKKVRARRGHINHDHDAFGMSSSNRRQPKRSINPAFLVAHNRNDTSSVSAESSNFHLFAKAIDVALMTGKLSVPNNLISSLERLDRCFDLHSQKKMEVYYSRDDSTKLWECRGEESLSSVDFSDNDLTFSSTDEGQGVDESSSSQRVSMIELNFIPT